MKETRYAKRAIDVENPSLKQRAIDIERPSARERARP